MSFDPNKITFFAKTDARGQSVPFGIKAIDRTKHVYVIGKTGMGKSTLLENMAVQDIANGEGMAFIDPHGQTAETILDYIPAERKDDVLYFAPFDTQNPVAFNVMEDVGLDKRHLVVSGLMSVFKKIWVDAWSARMEYILQNTLLALLEYPDSTLLGVNRMLSEKHYRKRVIDNISDPAVKSFWVDEFLNYNERYMQEAGDAIKNKIGQFTANPLIRNIIGQPKSSFDLRKMMDERKIIIMNLSKGLVGESNASLLGSMLTTRLYLAAMSRADLPVQELKQMPNFYFYVDEFQSFANATFADILSEARKYKLNLTIAHQYIEQMEEEVRNAVFGNVGTTISFRVGPFDAEVLETVFAPQFYATDLVNLGFAQIYLTLMIDGVGSRPFSATTLPPIQPKSESCKDMVIHRSREQFARPRGEVEAEIMKWHMPHADDPGLKSPREKRPLENGRGERAGFLKNGIRKPLPAAGENRSESRGSANQYSADRPQKRQKSESENPRKPEPTGKPVPQKSLDDLRSVLKSLSSQETPKRPEPAAMPEKNQKSESDSRKPSTEKGAAEEAAPKNGTDVKQALADVLKNITSNQPTSPSNTPPGSSPRQATLHQNPKPAEAVLAVPKASTEESKEPELHMKASPPPASRPTPESKQSEPEKTEVVAESRQEKTEKDPLDPKVLERMLRVTTSDKSPLK